MPLTAAHKRFTAVPSHIQSGSGILRRELATSCRMGDRTHTPQTSPAAGGGYAYLCTSNPISLQPAEPRKQRSRKGCRLETNRRPRFRALLGIVADRLANRYCPLTRSRSRGHRIGATEDHGALTSATVRHGRPDRRSAVDASYRTDTERLPPPPSAVPWGSGAGGFHSVSVGLVTLITAGTDLAPRIRGYGSSHIRHRALEVGRP